MGNIREVLAKNLKENRARLGLTQAELAEKAGISTTYVAMIELKRQFPAPDTLDKMADALGIQASELFTTPVSPIAALEKMQDKILANIEKVVDEAVQKAVAKRCKPVAGKEQRKKGKS